MLDVHQKPDKVELIMPMESLLSENVKLKLEEKFGSITNSFEHEVLSVLALTCDEGSVTNERLRYSLNLHKGQISELLKRMCQNELLVSQGYGRGMKYYLPEKTSNNLFSIISPGTNMASLGSNVATLEENMASSGSNVATPSKKRLSKQEMNELIKAVCVEWISLEDIALRIGKDYKYIRNHIIPRMLKEKTIEMLYPGTPNHPKQQYKIKN